jgi:hypothetical protein
LTSFCYCSPARFPPGLECRKLSFQFLSPRAKVTDVLLIKLYLLLPAAHLEFLGMDRFSCSRGGGFVFGKVNANAAEF